MVVAVLSVPLLPVGAAAQTQKCASEDVAAIDQYCEVLPTAEGQTSSASSPQQALRSALPQTQRVRLWRAGPPGRALLAIPPGLHLRVQGQEVRAQPLPGAAAALSGWLSDHHHGDRPVRAIGAAALGGDGLSPVFRWLLLISTVGLVGTAWIRRSR